MQTEKGYTIKEDAGLDWRRKVASPLPIDVIEKESISSLEKKGDIVIYADGRGNPVIEKKGKLEVFATVNDKDHESIKLQKLLNQIT